MRPNGYRGLEDFWRNRGFQRIAGLEASFSWKDMGEAHETAKPMEYWYKTLPHA